MNLDYQALGKRIRSYRKPNHMTQAQLGEKASVEPSNISHIERGATKVSLPTLVKIANSLKVSLDDLLYDSVEKNRHISIEEIDRILFDCSDKELKALAEILKTAKGSLRDFL